MLILKKSNLVKQIEGLQGINKKSSTSPSPPVDLYLIYEKSIWKHQVKQNEFLVYFELDFYCLCSLQKSISKRGLDFIAFEISNGALRFVSKKVFF